MKFISTLALCAALAFSLSPAFAQSTSQGTSSQGASAPPPSSAAAAEAKPKSAKSIECSKEADSKGLHGKARKHFRSKCKKGKTE